MKLVNISLINNKKTGKYCISLNYMKLVNVSLINYMQLVNINLNYVYFGLTNKMKLVNISLINYMKLVNTSASSTTCNW